MSFSSQILTFLGVSAIYIGFTFVWGWYKGKQDDEAAAAAAADERERVGAEAGDDRTTQTDTDATMHTETDDSETAENGGEH